MRSFGRDFLPSGAVHVRGFGVPSGHCSLAFHAAGRSSAPCGHKLGQADDVVGGHGEDESGADLEHARPPTVFVRPKAFLDALAQPSAPGSKARGHARGDLARDRGLARLGPMLAHRPVDCDMRLSRNRRINHVITMKRLAKSCLNRRLKRLLGASRSQGGAQQAGQSGGRQAHERHDR